MDPSKNLAGTIRAKLRDLFPGTSGTLAPQVDLEPMINSNKNAAIIMLKWMTLQKIRVRYMDHIDGLMQERRNSSSLAMVLRLSCINTSRYGVGSWAFIKYEDDVLPLYDCGYKTI